MIAHGLPIRYLLLAVAGEGPGRCSKVDYATAVQGHAAGAVGGGRRPAAAGPRTPPGKATTNPSGAYGAPRRRPIMTEQCGAGSLRLGLQSSRLRCC